MCMNFKLTRRREVIGWKVVAKKDGKYFSVMTGNQYPSNGRRMPVWVSQKKQALTYFDRLLPGNRKKHDQWIIEFKGCDWRSWNTNMAGRTAVFTHPSPAQNLRSDIVCMGKNKEEGFEFVVVKVKLTSKLLIAKYRCGTVFAGKKMEILEECEV